MGLWLFSNARFLASSPRSAYLRSAINNHIVTTAYSELSVR